jgi:hypothetical protein
MKAEKPVWRFFRAGGFDQVRLETAAELCALAQLDQKLWVALSCPVKGIEFDPQTLALIDSDNDGHVRAPELIRAIKWASARLLNPEVLTGKRQGIALADLRTDDEEGQGIAAAATQLVRDLGKSGQDVLTVEETSSAQAGFAKSALSAWETSGNEVRPLGDATAQAFDAMLAVIEKIDDYFVRCQLAAFDERAGVALNASDDAFKALSSQTLSTDVPGIEGMPIAKVTPSLVLNLTLGVNPAWAERLTTFSQLTVAPVLGQQATLSPEQWRELRNTLAPYKAWLDAKPDPTAADPGVRGLEKLARLVRDLQTLANNFVAFKDFYTRQGKATFQVGTLYLDGRSCELCVAVTDTARHASLAALSRIFLVYCECIRGSQKMTIAAAFTAGDSDQLIVGRNGVFYDRQGQDWDATITSIISHPISLSQAFWSPYKQLARMISTQMHKLAASKAQSSEDRMALAALQATRVPGPDKTAANVPTAPAAPSAFDVGKFAGIFAAIGLAVGAIGTALATALTGLFALHWWQIPLALLGLMLAISTPAVILAALKLRSRNLGPILDANGWAINARARINIPFGRTLTAVATLPANAQRSLSDPYAQRPLVWPVFAGCGLLAAVLLLAYWRLLVH